MKRGLSKNWQNERLQTMDHLCGKRFKTTLVVDRAVRDLLQTLTSIYITAEENIK